MTQLYFGAAKIKQVVKVIWHKAASPQHMDGSVVFASIGANVHPYIESQKMVAMATSLSTSGLYDSLGPSQLTTQTAF